MAPDDDVCIVDSSSSAPGSSVSGSSSCSESYSGSSGSCSYPEDELSSHAPSGGGTHLDACKLPPIERGTITDNVTTDDFSEKLDQSLSFFEAALTTCLDCKHQSVGLHRQQCLTSQREELAKERLAVKEALKRLRDPPNDDSSPKRQHLEGGEPVGKPEWLEDLQQLVDSMKPTTTTNSADICNGVVRPVQFLLQPPPVVNIHSAEPRVPETEQTSRDKKLGLSGALSETGSSEQTVACPKCAEVEVVLQKEKVQSILPVYSELWRLRRERHRLAAQKADAASQQLAAQTNLFDRMKQQIEKELKYHHQFFLTKCLKESDNLPSLTQLHKDVEELEELRRHLDLAQQQLVFTTPSVDGNKKASKPPSTETVQMTSDLVITSRNELSMSLERAKQENEELHRKVLRSQQEVQEWKIQYEVARRQLQQTAEQRGYISKDLVPSLVKSETENLHNVVRALGWDIQSVSRFSAVLVDPLTKTRKEISLPPSTAGEAAEPSTALMMARHLVQSSSKPLSVMPSLAPALAPAQNPSPSSVSIPSVQVKPKLESQSTSLEGAKTGPIAHPAPPPVDTTAASAPPIQAEVVDPFLSPPHAEQGIGVVVAEPSHPASVIEGNPVHQETVQEGEAGELAEEEEEELAAPPQSLFSTNDFSL